MQNVQAKKESLMRILGMGLILFGLLISIILDYIFVMANLTLNLLIFLVILPWLLLIILLKLEKDFIVDHVMIFFIILCVYTIIIIFVALPFSPNESTSLLFITNDMLEFRIFNLQEGKIDICCMWIWLFNDYSYFPTFTYHDQFALVT